MPDSAQIGQSRVRQEVTSWRASTPVGNCFSQAVRHALLPLQSFSQLRRFVQLMLLEHVSSSEQQSFVAHSPH